MKKVLLLTFAFIAGFSVMAQQKADDVMSVNAEKFDFGKIKQGVPVTTYFTLTNTSDKPIVIENAWAGCGCTTPEYSKEPIPAGGTSKLKVGYNAAAMGRFDKAVNIKLAGFQDPKVITITGEVVDGTSLTSTKDSKTSQAAPAKTTKSSQASKVKKTSK